MDALSTVHIATDTDENMHNTSSNPSLCLGLPDLLTLPSLTVYIYSFQLAEGILRSSAGISARRLHVILLVRKRQRDIQHYQP